ncbi:P-loop containing nucleoside triphosphate hydrolase protein [Lactarius deliciosus]|nr:P-loop containing nucleoside triphosphate hydrolase protein [Lactarius deliciosus]
MSCLSPICSRRVPEELINQHLDANCRDTILGPSTPTKIRRTSSTRPVAPIFRASGSAKHDLFTSQRTQHAAVNKPSQKRRTTGDIPQLSHTATSVKRTRHTIGLHLQAASPLAERLRPNILDDFVGQVHLTGPNSFLSTLSENGAIGSIILWGPPGCGKTTLARLISKRTNAIFRELSATVVGINDVRPIFDEAKNALKLTGRRTIIFLDEIHRFTRSQQDIFLPFLERGYVQLIGATTENPSFKLNGALLSRCRQVVFSLERLTDEEITEIIKRAIARVTSSEPDAEVTSTPTSLVMEVASIPSSPPPSSPLGSPRLPSSQLNAAPEQSTPPPSPLHPLSPTYPHITYRVVGSMASLSAGDARTALSLLEHVLLVPTDTPESALLDLMKRSVATSYDRTGDARYNLISALHKSIRGNQGGAALYWLARMLGADEDPMYIARRLVVCASEDVGMADPHALPLAMAALQACQVIGMPECRINLAHVVTYLSEAPKSTRALEGYNRARELAQRDMTLPVPFSMRNAPTGLMKELGYGEGYNYQPNFAHPVTNEYLPLEIQGETILRKADDLTGKKWDDDALRQWEEIENGGQVWAGRPSQAPDYEVISSRIHHDT